MELARKTEWEAERAAQEAVEKADRAEHRKWLKETKPHRDAQRARQQRRHDAKARIFHAVWRGTEAVADAASLFAEAII